VKKGDCVNLSPYAMGRMEWLWGKDAADYNPDRFMKDGICQQESPFKLPAFLVNRLFFSDSDECTTMDG
jgi:cytochrome P450